MSDETKLTDDEAAQMLATLSKHFGEPVMPIGRYCKGLRTWQDALCARAERLRAELFPGIDGPYDDPATKAVYDAYRAEMEKVRSRDWQEKTERDYELDRLRGYQDEGERVGGVFLQIGKSNLLARLLYGGEPLRSTPCPTHKGKWSGCFGECEHGCELTGWLPEPAA